MVISSGRPVGNATVFHDVDQQRLRILRCTARAMASSPGGLHFQPGAQPWLEGLAPGHPAAMQLAHGETSGDRPPAKEI